MEVEHLNGKNGQICLYAWILSVRKSHHLRKFLLSAEDLRQHNDKLVELNSSKMTLQMKLDELEAAEVNIKVILILVVGIIHFAQSSHTKNY